MRTTGLRQDTSRNQQQLLKVAQKLLAEAPAPLSMRQLASEAQVSPASVYRYYGSIEGVVEAFRSSVISEVVEFSAASTETGIRLLEDVCLQWVDLVIRDGRAMSHSRSRQGYLARLRNEAPDLKLQEAAMHRPLVEACKELGITIPDEEALFLWNQIFDPRDVLDLMSSLELSRTTVSGRLVRTLLGALRGWAAPD
ncbi:TetR/AcrR family transcriptional regulator [Glaciibacter superstes]|uniref:TetR/AcrR family transcriptional regulator n=1 Tax=Glaciibacter superstes TaxID=501023 RepID=UPI0003B47896|nr:TetR/AcrR family transcriptional regulator [Glaciibacter superstes]